MDLLFGNFEHSDFFFFFSAFKLPLLLQISKVPSTCNQPLNNLQANTASGPPERTSGATITQGDVNTRVFQKQFDNWQVATGSGENQGRGAVKGLQIDINFRMCQKEFDNFRAVFAGGLVEGRVALIAVVPIDVEVGGWSAER